MIYGCGQTRLESTPSYADGVLQIHHLSACYYSIFIQVYCLDNALRVTIYLLDHLALQQKLLVDQSYVPALAGLL